MAIKSKSLNASRVNEIVIELDEEQVIKLEDQAIYRLVRDRLWTIDAKGITEADLGKWCKIGPNDDDIDWYTVEVCREDDPDRVGTIQHVSERAVNN